MTIAPGGVFGSRTASDMLREAQNGQAVVIAAVVGPSYAVYDGRGMWDAMTRTLDGGVTGFENAGSAFAGYGRQNTVGNTSMYSLGAFAAFATDSQANNASAVTEFAAWQGANVLADCVNVRDATTLSTQDVAIVASSGLSWFPTTNPGDDLSKNVVVYTIFGQYGGEGVNLLSVRSGMRNRNSTANVASGAFATAQILEPDVNGEITGSTALLRASYSTPRSATSRIYGTSEETTTGLEARLAHFVSAPSGLSARQVRGKLFHAGTQILRRGANAGNSISWVIASAGGNTYAQLADFFDTTAKQTAVQLRADEMKANLVARGDTRPVYVIFFAMEDANTFSTVGADETTYLAQVNDLMDNLKACGDAFTSVDGYAIMHQGQPPQLTVANAGRTAAYEAYRGFNASNANDIATSHNYQWLDPMVYTDPANAWTSGFTLWKNEGDTTVHFTDAGHRLMTTEAVLASLGYATQAASGGHRSRARYNRAR